MKEEEKVVNFEESKDKKKGKRFLAAVASCAIILVGANVYASTQGYGNVFFMIKSAITGTEVTNKDELLKDREILISYHSIEIADGVEIQINKLAVENGNGKLYLYVNADETQKSSIPVFYKVYDISNNNNLIGEKQDKSNDSYNKEIDLKNIKENTKKLKLELLNEEKQTLFVAEIDLNSKEINVLESAQKEIEKISEVELKEILAIYAGLNEHNDLKYDLTISNQQLRNEELFEIVTDLASDYVITETSYYYPLDKVNNAIKEITGKKPEGVLDVSDNYLMYDDEVNGYRIIDPSYGSIKAMCLEIKDLSYLNGIYTATFIYCYPSKEDPEKSNIENLEQFETTMKFKLNDNYEYTKYCLVDYENIESRSVKESEKNTNSTINESHNTSNVNNNTSGNKLSETKRFGNYEVSNIKINVEDGQTQILADVKNVGSNKTNSEIIDIIILDKNGNEIDTRGGIIGEINPGESVQLNAWSTESPADLVINAYDVNFKADNSISSNQENIIEFNEENYKKYTNGDFLVDITDVSNNNNGTYTITGKVYEQITEQKLPTISKEEMKKLKEGKQIEILGYSVLQINESDNLGGYDLLVEAKYNEAYLKFYVEQNNDGTGTLHYYTENTLARFTQICMKTTIKTDVIDEPIEYHLPRRDYEICVITYGTYNISFENGKVSYLEWTGV